MKYQGHPQTNLHEQWCWLVSLATYDRQPLLYPTEQEELAKLIEHMDGKHNHWPRRTRTTLQRLVAPLDAVLDLTDLQGKPRTAVTILLLRQMHHLQQSLWEWDSTVWLEILCTNNTAFQQRSGQPAAACRQHVLAVAYLLGGFTDFGSIGRFDQSALAKKVFGPALVDAAIQQVSNMAARWGYGKSGAQHVLPNALCEVLLANRNPYLEAITLERLDEIRQWNIASYLKSYMVTLSRILAHLGILPRPLDPLPKAYQTLPNGDALAGVPAEWSRYCQRWLDTSTLASKPRIYYHLLKVGRWLAIIHPEVVEPAQWTREIATEYVAAVSQMVVGQWVEATKGLNQEIGKPLTAKTKASHLGALRIFFRDCQEWGWAPRRFDPRRSLATPRAIQALIGPDPRTIEDDSWAKLLWAGLNLTLDDLPVCFKPREGQKRVIFYPLEMVRAMVVVWLFAGLRSNEIRRLRVGCISFQREDIPLYETGEILSRDAVCWLSIPVHKTGTAFTKAVDRVVGEAIEAWERVRPVQPPAVDPKTAEVVYYLFSYRGKRIGEMYLNNSLIPLLCKKGGVPEADARGDITSHRARSTIATQLYNAREPMTLFELQEWLGHRYIGSTQQYAKVKPTKVAKSYEKAGYFERNTRTIEVLIDQDVIKSGAAVVGEPWRFFDLGHGYCTYEFFDQCPHRMACARCSFYRPKGSSQAQLLEGKANLLHMLQEIPLSEEERAAVEDGIEAMEKLCQRLVDVPTPAGPTPKQLETGKRESKTVIPLEQVRRKR
jgi:integrase